MEIENRKRPRLTCFLHLSWDCLLGSYGGSSRPLMAVFVEAAVQLPVRRTRTQQVFQLAPQGSCGERLLQKFGACLGHPILAKGLHRIPRHEEHLHLRTEWRQMSCQLSPAHLWHLHVGHHQPDWALLPFRGRESLVAVTRLQHSVTP